MNATVTCSACHRVHAAVLSTCPHCSHRASVDTPKSGMYALAPGRANMATPPTGTRVPSLDSYAAHLSTLQAGAVPANAAESSAAHMAAAATFFVIVGIGAATSAVIAALVIAPFAAGGTWWVVRRVTA